ncbi:Gfo/Idh/MocA family protein [Goodfellowiella coeruleoviolacea]|uniref:Dehydrogenase n=1 Tax=Goodfellowiella coeruleoviolacea TaxID=334858 RepID=A0AAE3GBY6_9PSEU|nr:Gfo/Idh/MocA family oxidoreductase [Goodfellowiella coeruleoviolacea]MCP2165467.1 putative dehydrogenase [Goodfellowiella coeruleoviolacea]
MVDHVRIGILGAARIAPTALVRPARRSREARVVAVAARDPERARQFAGRHGIPVVHRDYQALLDDPSIDAVYNPLPNGLHGRWTLAALAAGKHVLCEKPFAANAEEARTVARAARDSGRVVLEAFHYRYHPLAQRMRNIVESGELGMIQHVEAWMCLPLPRFSDIRYRFDLAGGALMDAGCYAVHLVRLLGGVPEGEPQVVSARARRHGVDVDRFMRARLRFPAGHTGQVVASLWSPTTPLRISAKVVGDAGELRVLNPVAPQYFHRLAVRTDDHHRTEHFGRRSSYAYQLDAFTAAVLRGAPVLTPPEDAIATMSVVDDIYRAAGLPLRQPS